MKLTSSTPTGILPTPSAGSNYQITFTGDWDGATASLDIWDSITSEFVPTTVGIFQDGGQTTANLSATGPMIRATLSGADTATDLEFSVEYLGSVTSPLMTEAILEHIKGAKADLVNGHVPQEQLPDELNLDAIIFGEYAPGVEAQEGTVVRLGNNLLLYPDDSGEPVVVGGRGTMENTIPYHRVSGTATIFPFGVSGSPVKQAGTRYWQEIARVKVPGIELVAGNVLRFTSELHVESTTAISGIANGVLLVPSEYWDVSPQSTYFGATPTTGGAFNTLSANFLRHAVGGANTLKSTSKTTRSHSINWASGYFYCSGATAGTYQYGYDWTAAAAFSSNIVNGLPTFARENLEDMEFVVVAQCSATAMDFRVLHYNINIFGKLP